MIKKVIKKLKKVFIPKSEFIEEEPKKVEKPREQYIGVVAPVVTPFDSWFSKPVKTEKVIAHEEKVAEVVKQKEAEQPKSKEPENIHQQMYERASKYWGTWKEELPGGSENFQSGWNSGTGMGQFK
jgi:hypothetical protein